MTPTGTPVEILVGRTLAVCAHPIAAWRRRSFRVLMLAGYTAAGYVATLGVLALLAIGK